jgi:hypothetical protein
MPDDIPAWIDDDERELRNPRRARAQPVDERSFTGGILPWPGERRRCDRADYLCVPRRFPAY